MSVFERVRNNLGLLRGEVLLISRREGFKNNCLFSLQGVRKPEAAPGVP
jgi:hypothetical protein